MVNRDAHCDESFNEILDLVTCVKRFPTGREQCMKVAVALTINEADVQS